MSKFIRVFGGVSSGSSDYFAEAFDFTDKLFRILGITNEKRKWAAFAPLLFIYSWSNLLTPVFMAVFMINSIDMGGVHKIFETMCGLSASINGTVKVMTYYFKSEKIIKLKRIAVEELNKYNRIDSPTEYGHAVKLVQIMNMISKYLTATYSICSVMFNIFPFIFYFFDLPRDDWMLPLTLRVFFVSNKSHPGYEITFLISGYLVNSICLSLAATDLIFMHLCFYAFIQLAICKTYCSQIGDASNGPSPRQQYEHLRKCIIMFAKICLFVEDVARIFIWSIFMQCIVSVLVITSSVSYLKYSVVSFGLLSSILVELIGYCWIGQMILNMSNDVNANVCASNWEPLLKDRKTSRALIFFIKHTQKRNELSAFGLVQMSFETIMRVLRATFSYVAFVQNVTN